MASYASYKKVHGDQMVNGTLTDNDINSNTLNHKVLFLLDLILEITN